MIIVVNRTAQATDGGSQTGQLTKREGRLGKEAMTWKTGVGTMQDTHIAHLLQGSSAVVWLQQVVVGRVATGTPGLAAETVEVVEGSVGHGTKTRETDPHQAASKVV